MGIVELANSVDLDNSAHYGMSHQELRFLPSNLLIFNFIYNSLFKISFSTFQFLVLLGGREGGLLCKIKLNP